jgi:hypothetical protein
MNKLANVKRLAALQELDDVRGKLGHVARLARSTSKRIFHQSNDGGCPDITWVAEQLAQLAEHTARLSELLAQLFDEEKSA